LDREAKRHFEHILNLMHKNFSQVEVTRYDISEERAVLKLRGRHGNRNVFVTEVLISSTRWYSYYLLRGDYILIGLDNFSDRPALRLKYGEAFIQHLHEPIPHLHTENKERLELTDEKTLDDFVQMVMELKDR